MKNQSLCRIGVFYDGTYFSKAQRYFYYQLKTGWLEFQRFHELIERFVWSKEQGYTHYKIVYAAWFQGLFKPSEPTEGQLRFDRRLYYDLMYAGVEPKYLPKAGPEEKGVDVALAVDAMQVGMDGKIDVAALITGDGNIVPLARALMKQSVAVMVVYFDYEDGQEWSGASDYLLSTCNYVLNFNKLEDDKDYRTDFRNAFRRKEEEW